MRLEPSHRDKVHKAHLNFRNIRANSGRYLESVLDEDKDEINALETLMWYGPLAPCLFVASVCAMFYLSCGVVSRFLDFTSVAPQLP